MFEIWGDKSSKIKRVIISTNTGTWGIDNVSYEGKNSRNLTGLYFDDGRFESGKYICCINGKPVDDKERWFELLSEDEKVSALFHVDLWRS